MIQLSEPLNDYIKNCMMFFRDVIGHSPGSRRVVVASQAPK
jgi:hypothetical protein